MVKLGEVCRIVGGGTPSRKIDRYYEGTIPWVTVKDLKGYSIEDSQEHITEEAIQNSATNLIPAGTVITCTRMALGKALINRLPVAINQDLKALICGENTHPEYLRYFLSSKSDWIISQGSGATVKGIKLDVLRDLDFPDISLPEQQRIAEILDLADEARRKRRENLSLYDDLIRSLFLKTFGDPCANSKGWKTKKLGALVAVDAPMVDPRLEEYLDLLHIGPDRIEKETGRLFPALTAREDKLISGKFLFDDRYVLYSKIRPYLRKVALPSFTGLCSADVYPVRPLDGLLTREFLWQLLLGTAFLRYTQSLPSRANIPKLNRKELDAYVSIKPPIELQEEFSLRVQEINAQKAREQVLCDEHDDLFNALLQRAFKGEL